MITYIKHIVLNNKTQYLVVNILLSVFAFGRQFIYMKELSLYDLGVLTIIQTIVIFISMLQFGLLNGGYRIFSLGKRRVLRKTNNVLFTYFLFLFITLAIGWVVANFIGLLTKHNYFIFIALCIGIISLINNWSSNALIATQQLKKLNTINMVSALLGLFSLIFVFYMKVWGAIISLSVQPIVFIMFCLVSTKELRPSKFEFGKTIFKYLFHFGFTPFIAGIFVIVNLQIERGSIGFFLGTAKLGEFYLVFLYSSLFILIPSSLLNIFFPKMLQLYRGKKISLFYSSFKKYLLLLFLYLVVILFLTFTVMPPFISVFLPKHMVGLKYLYYALPGVIAVTLVDPLSLIFNSIALFKPLFWTYLSSVFVNVFSVTVFVFLDSFNLVSAAIIRSIVYVYVLLVLYLVFLINKKKYFNTGGNL